MRLEVRFRHMDRSEALEELVTNKVNGALENFSHRHDCHVQVWLVSELNRNNRGTPHFLCEIEVRYPQKKDVFVSRDSNDMNSAVQAAVDTVEELLTEEAKRELSARTASVG
jgi:ribosome-associated translation inhibitor RaiA